jgi:hypothetical protein
MSLALCQIEKIELKKKQKKTGFCTGTSFSPRQETFETQHTRARLHSIWIELS